MKHPYSIYGGDNLLPSGWNRGKVAAKIWLGRILKRPPAPYVPPDLNCHQTDIANDCDVAHCLMKNNAILALNLQYGAIQKLRGPIVVLF